MFYGASDQGDAVWVLHDQSGRVGACERREALVTHEDIEYIALVLIFGAGVIGVGLFFWTIYANART